MHGKKLKREKADATLASQATSGIKSLSKEKREMLEVTSIVGPLTTSSLHISTHFYFEF